MIRENNYLLSKQDTSKFLECFHYTKEFSLGSCVPSLCWVELPTVELKAIGFPCCEMTAPN